MVMVFKFNLKTVLTIQQSKWDKINWKVFLTLVVSDRGGGSQI